MVDADLAVDGDVEIFLTGLVTGADDDIEAGQFLHEQLDLLDRGRLGRHDFQCIRTFELGREGPSVVDVELVRHAAHVAAEERPIGIHGTTTAHGFGLVGKRVCLCRDAVTGVPLEARLLRGAGAQRDQRDHAHHGQGGKTVHQRTPIVMTLLV